MFVVEFFVCFLVRLGNSRYLENDFFLCKHLLTGHTSTELERAMNIVGAAAAKLKRRLDMIYAIRSESAADGRKFSGLHDTLLPMASATRSIFQMLRGSSTHKKKNSAASASKKQESMSGKILGKITGVDLRHLLLLLPFLLFDLLDDEIQHFNQINGTDLVNPAHVLIKFVLLLLEWYHLYRSEEICKNL